MQTTLNQYSDMNQSISAATEPANRRQFLEHLARSTAALAALPALLSPGPALADDAVAKPGHSASGGQRRWRTAFGLNGFQSSVKGSHRLTQFPCLGRHPRMARKLRIEYPGAIYHVMNRGDRREAIFLADKDRELFVATLAEACAKADWQIQ